MIAFSIPFVVLNMIEVWEIWTSPNPPRSLEAWTTSSASQYFALYYTIVHALLVPFILGSGLGGVLATMWLLYDLFKNPIHLEKYRRTEQVINFSTWLLMWALIGFAAVSFLGRATIIDSPGNQLIDVVGFVQSLIAVGIIFIIFGAPMIFARQAINKAKYKELYSLEEISQTLHDLQFQDLETGNKNPEMFKQEPASAVKGVNEWLEITTGRIQSVDNIPSLPIHVSSLLRVAIGAIIALGSGLISDWIMINVISPK
jgi:hypothetical protein